MIPGVKMVTASPGLNFSSAAKNASLQIELSAGNVSTLIYRSSYLSAIADLKCPLIPDNK